MNRTLFAGVGLILAALAMDAGAVSAQFRTPRGPTSPPIVRSNTFNQGFPFQMMRNSAIKPYGFNSAFFTYNPYVANAFMTYQTPRGPVAPAIPGNYNPTTGQFNPSAVGSTVLTSRGVFTPTDGKFVPAANGRFLLTSRQVFDPTTGKFAPSPTGPYVFSTQGNLISTTTGTAVPVSMTGLGRLNPLNPISPYNPINQQAYLMQVQYAATLRDMLYGSNNPYTSYNPYLSNAYPMSGQATAYGSGFTNGYYNGLGNPYPSPYQAPVGGGAPATGPVNIPPYVPGGAVVKSNPALAALGVENDDGVIRWPFALRLMSPDKKRDLLDKLEGQLQIVGSQRVAGKANPAVVAEARETLQQVYAWLNGRRLDIAEGAFTEADTMLRNLDKMLH